MGQKTCPSCGGRGGYYGSESVPNYAPGGSLWTTVQVWKSCGPCLGTGQVWAPDDPLPTSTFSGSGGRTSRQPPPVPVDDRTPEEKQHDAEDAVASLFMLATWGGIGWHGVTAWPVAWYWPVGVAFVAGVAVYRILTRRLRIIPKAIVWGLTLLTKLLALAALVALIGGLIYLFTGQANKPQRPQPVARPQNEPIRAEPRVGVEPVQRGFGVQPPNETDRGERSAQRGRRNRSQPDSAK